MINLTQHTATPDQVAAGVVDLPPEVRAEVGGLLTFDTLPTQEEIRARALRLALIARESGHDSALIGGAAWLMEPLARHLDALGVSPFFAFTRRVSMEITRDDGTVTKTQVFKHEGFITA